MTNPITRLLSRTTETPGPLATACWITSYSPNQWGYVQIKVDGRAVVAHRLMYETCVGPIPTGLQLDHLCRRPGCINPTHLEPTSPRENTLRSMTYGARAVRTNQCKHGHSLTDAYVRKNGRQCRTCALLWSKKQKAALRAARARRTR